jgi:hypothetical protein
MRSEKKSDDLYLMTMADACLFLKVSRRTLYRMIAVEVVSAPRKIGNFRQKYFLRNEFEKQCRRSLG